MENREGPTRSEPSSAGGSERGFGVVFTVVFTVVGGWPLLDGQPPRGWALAVAGAILATARAKPAWLAPFNRVWFRFGRLLQRVVHPVVMAVLYFGVVTSTGLVMRVLCKDPLRLRRDPAAESYWIRRDPPGPTPESMKNQF